MDWAQPNYSRSQVNAAGERYANPHASFRDIAEAAEVLNNWRAAHQYPLNTFQIFLRGKSRNICDNAIVSQRLKRIESIERKLRSGTMKMSQMQDIGGCRSVVETIEQVREIEDCYSRARFEHEFKNKKDYIESPKDDGYRSVHLIYRYKGKGKLSVYDGLQIEIQLRTQLQHAWATAVEAVGTFTRQALKWKGGDAEWRNFFLLMGAAIALIEGGVVGANVPQSKRELGQAIDVLARKLHVANTLSTYNMTLNYTGKLKKSEAKLILVNMKPDDMEVNVQGFKQKESSQANFMYKQMEQKIPPGAAEQVVLVQVDSLNNLRRAYPNLFLDTFRFSEVLKEILSWK